ncbi:MAG: glucose-6-phosphate isomerase [Clostridiales bacterium]|nr:glucose-6-phosphate isomerase [Clostridiales bacterium]
MENIKLDYSNVLNFLTEEEIYAYQESIEKAHNDLHNKTGEGSDFLGWVELPTIFDKQEYRRIKRAAEYIKENAQALIVIGIGGSYLGARAVIDALSNSFGNKGTRIYYAGNNISSKYLNDLINEVKGKDICINVISKSGTTTEPAIAFRIFKELIENKYGKEQARNRIFVTTDKQKGVLKTLADNEGYETFVVPDDVGGRYSVLTAVGLLPIAVSGINIDKLMVGAKDMQDKLMNTNIEENDCYKYAVIRNILYKAGKKIEIMVNYEPSLHYFTEWFKQLFGESEGKDQKGIFPAGVDNTTDLHSMGQYIQEGERTIFETILNIQKDNYMLSIKEQEEDIGDGLKFLEGKTIDYINKKAMEGTILAHVDGGVPNMKIDIPELNEYYIGSLIYFFEKACGISGYLLGVNPFNQPGVEAYKKNMFKLLGKPGY